MFFAFAGFACIVCGVAVGVAYPANGFSAIYLPVGVLLVWVERLARFDGRLLAPGWRTACPGWAAGPFRWVSQR